MLYLNKNKVLAMSGFWLIPYSYQNKHVFAALKKNDGRPFKNQGKIAFPLWVDGDAFLLILSSCSWQLTQEVSNVTVVVDFEYVFLIKSPFQIRGDECFRGPIKKDSFDDFILFELSLKHFFCVIRDQSIGFKKGILIVCFGC